MVVKLKKINDIYNVDLTELTHSFQDACADKDFKKFVYDLNIKEEILMKYTSILEEAYEEYKNCANCKGLSTCKNSEKGYRLNPVDGGNIINFSYDACSKYQKEISDNKYKENLDLFEMNEEIKNASFKMASSGRAEALYLDFLPTKGL